jgi:hypothetical protein
MARRDVAAMAAKSWPDENSAFRRGYRWFDELPDSRTRGPGQGLDASDDNQRDNETEAGTEHRSPQWRAAERLFSRAGAV